MLFSVKRKECTQSGRVEVKKGSSEWTPCVTQRILWSWSMYSKLPRAQSWPYLPVQKRNLENPTSDNSTISSFLWSPRIYYLPLLQPLCLRSFFRSFWRLRNQLSAHFDLLSIDKRWCLEILEQRLEEQIFCEPSFSKEMGIFSCPSDTFSQFTQFSYHHVNPTRMGNKFSSHINKQLSE